MEVVTGALPSVITKLGDLLIGEYNLQKGVKGEIRFLQSELESMKVALEKVSSTPPDQLDMQDKIWARDLRELSYDIEDSIDTFMVRGKANQPVELHGIRKFIDRSVGLFRKAKIRHGIATEIKDIKSRVTEVHERRLRYGVNNGVGKTTTSTVVDPRLLAHYTEAKGLVGIDETRDELIKILMDGNGVPLQQGKIVSIVGFGGLGKTTLARTVYEKIRGQFDCCAFVSVSQTPDLNKLLKGLLYDLGKNINEETLDEWRLIDVVREFLQTKRYLVVIDDIWDISVWGVIKFALPDNDAGYKVITTTRNAHVAEKAGGVYKLKALTEDNSRKLLYRRVFGNENNLDVENMRKILSFSYYNMPSHLRICLLYLSMFPEDYEVEKGRLIRMWIGEGFIKCEKQGKSLFEHGESYFNELINRSMIQPIYLHDDTLYGCRVHDMVLDLICSLSSEANFITIFSRMDHISSTNSIRRLSLQNGKEDNTMAPAGSRFQQVRSLAVHKLVTSLIPVLGSFHVLRVLDLENCDLSNCYSRSKWLGNLLHLRYLGLSSTGIVQLPEEIGHLQFLQILDIGYNKIACLPSKIVQLKHLMSLNMDSETRVPNGFGSLTSLEELSGLRVDDSNMDSILEELGQLMELRVLHICFPKWRNNDLVECLHKLQKIQHIAIWSDDSLGNMGALDAWVAPRHLRGLNTGNSCWFSKLPAWMNRSHLPYLSTLFITMSEIQQSDLDVLGRLPALRRLCMSVRHVDLGILGELVVGADSFGCLTCCELRGFARPIVFQQGSMQMLRSLYLFHLSVREAHEMAGRDGVGPDFGWGRLPSLEFINVLLDSRGARKEEVKKFTAVLRHASKIHPNHLRLYINGIPDEVSD